MTATMTAKEQRELEESVKAHMARVIGLYGEEREHYEKQFREAGRRYMKARKIETLHLGSGTRVNP